MNIFRRLVAPWRVELEALKADYEKELAYQTTRAARAEAELEATRRRARIERVIAERRFNALLEHLTKAMSLQPPSPMMLRGDIPDPPSVSAADAKVAVALRDREAPPLKRPLRPGEDA